jgi:hypothetical protein
MFSPSPVHWVFHRFFSAHRKTPMGDPSATPDHVPCHGAGVGTTKIKLNILVKKRFNQSAECCSVRNDGSQELSLNLIH